MSKPFRPTRFERYLLTNQFLILEALYPEDASQYAHSRHILSRGYELLYSELLQHIYDGDDVMTKEESLEVWDTLDMFDAIDRGLKDHPTTEIPNSGFKRFFGYDGNTEGKFMAFAEFTMKELGRFSYVPLYRENYWNSHFPVRDVYLRMLAVWKPLDTKSRFNLTPILIRDILAASIHHDNSSRL